MYAFIILQQQIFSSQEYKYFITQKVKKLKTVSKIKGQAMAYLYNNFKIQKTIKNQIEKENMLKKLSKVDKQVKKWIKALHEKKSSPSIIEESKSMKEIESLQMKEIPEQKDENEVTDLDKELLSIKDDSDKDSIEIKEEAKDKEEKHYLADYQDLEKAQLVKKLVEEKLSFLWKLQIY